ncbi:hypothetical protein [Jeongeupia naejangsanensis]|uniref:Uncharacterized protein n=1 Tax=Jeongeupia naejangsanensis TaxID=613195 RepID=A0ABS2BP45_9NEIS|nr:hypothetical protein [Jeongeupia naejangsanensis]MBM3117389.1 hypothetical protein [Jeongeupia naejangsanensis]
MRHLSFTERRIVCDYLRALRNEIAVDEKALALSGLPPRAQVRLPRPALWLSMGRKAAWILPFFKEAAGVLWRVFGAVYFGFQRNSLHGLDSARLQPQLGGQILALSSRCGDIVHAGHIKPLPSQWLTLPWAPLGPLPEGAQQTPMLSLLSDEDMDRALRLARCAHRVVHRRRKLRVWGLQTYTALRWFAVRFVIDKLPGPLLMVEHFDRWAVLVDSSVAASRRNDRSRYLTLMQHGSVGAEENYSALNVNLPSRLRAVAHLHVYSDADAAVFRRSILSTSCEHRGVEVSYFRPRIELIKFTAETTKPRVLFVGHPLCEALHLRVLETLLLQQDVLAYYKPHPVAAKNSAAVFQQVWTVIEGRGEFPEVDLLVSYPSTMVQEYKTHGVAAVVHPIDLGADNAADLVVEIAKQLNQRHIHAKS